MRPLIAILLVQLVIGGTFAVLAATGNLPFGDDSADGDEAPAAAARPTVDEFDSARAFRWLKRQVRFGPRPAGSRASRRLAAELRAALPLGSYQGVPGGLRNVVGRVRGTDPSRVVVVGAHYDTKDIPGFVGANDAASGTATVIELARQVKRRPVAPTVVFILFDGEESPRGTPDFEFERRGLRGSKVAAPRYRDAEAMILLDFVGDRRLRTAREANSDPALWERLRAAAQEVGAGRHFPDETVGPISDDHLPFIRQGVPSIDLIDFTFPCFHRTCDDLSAVSEASLDATGETVLRLLRTL
jgi:glutaminyl-peptide cyclotransferase